MNSRRAVIIDDDKFISHAYTDGLQRAGFRIETAFNGEEGLKKAKELKPDIILLDIILPQKDGFVVLKEIKADEKLKNIPVLIISNLSQEGDIKVAKKLGAADYLVKSNYSMDKVVEKIKSFLK